MVQIELVASANPRRLLCPAMPAKSILEKRRELSLLEESPQASVSPNPFSGSTCVRATRWLRAAARFRSFSAPRA